MTPYLFPQWLIGGLVTSILIFGPFAFGAVEPWSLSVLEILIFSLLFVCAWNQEKSGNVLIRQLLFPPLLFLALLAFLQYVNPSLLHGPKPLLPSTVAPHETRHAILKWSAYAAFVWCLPKILARRPHVVRLAWTIFLLGCAISLIGVVQRNSGDGVSIYGVREVNRGTFPFGPYYNPDHAASMMVMSVFVGLGIFGMRFFTPARGNRLEFVVTQTCFLFMVGVTIFGILQTKSRGALLSMLCIGTCTCLITNWKFNKFRYKHVTSALIIGVLAFSVMVICVNPVGFRTRQVDLMSSISFRGALYQAGWKMLLDSPITGAGMGAFRVAYPIYQPSSVMGTVHHIHSDWFELALQAGILGLFAFAGGVILLIKRGIQQIVAVREGEVPFLAIGGTAAASAFCLHGLIDFSFQIPANAILFLSAACISVLPSQNLVPALPSHQRPSQRRAYLTCILSVGLILLSAPAGIGSIYRLRADHSTESSKEMLLSHAIYWDGRPEYFKLLGEAKLAAEPRETSLRDALMGLIGATRMEPANRHFRHLEAEALVKLRRLREHAGRQRP